MPHQWSIRTQTSVPCGSFHRFFVSGAQTKELNTKTKPHFARTVCFAGFFLSHQALNSRAHTRARDEQHFPKMAQSMPVSVLMTPVSPIGPASHNRHKVTSRPRGPMVPMRCAPVPPIATVFAVPSALPEPVCRRSKFWPVEDEGEPTEKGYSSDAHNAAVASRIEDMTNTLRNSAHSGNRNTAADDENDDSSSESSSSSSSTIDDTKEVAAPIAASGLRASVFALDDDDDNDAE